MSFMDKGTTYSPWSRIEVLVGTPDSKVDIPIMEVEENITNCVGQIPTDFTALGLLYQINTFAEAALVMVLISNS